VSSDKVDAAYKNGILKLKLKKAKAAKSQAFEIKTG